ncbi:MAG: hypothetical protein LKF37_13050 [Lentilactobacillus diolivorans]|jgi:hypothetical protein|nr:hypothetical protein [Lentilactobacillus diolivorans]
MIKNKGFNQTMTYLKAHPKQARQYKWSKIIKGFEKTSLMIKKGLGGQYQLRVIAYTPQRQSVLTVVNGHGRHSFVK